MLNPAKASRTALMNAAQNLAARNKYAEAEPLVAGMLAKDGHDAEALLLMAEILYFQGRPDIRYYMRAVCADTSNRVYKEKFIQRCWLQVATAYDSLTGDAILACLQSGRQVDCAKLQRFWYSHLKHRSEFKQSFEGVLDLQPFLTPYFLLGIQHLVVADSRFEDLVTKLRRQLLEGPVNEKEYTVLAVALAHYSFHTDYILDVTEAEQSRVDELILHVESGDASDFFVALLACYMPLYKLKNISAARKNDQIESLFEEQIEDHLRLQQIAKSVVALTSVESGTSADVQQQYEESPYPRWRTFSTESLARGWNESGGGWDTGVTDVLRGRKIKILIAGCGTGQEACAVATLFPNADILAVDLSRASLAYAIHKSKEYGCKNITFQQADILRMDNIGQKFDYITSSGVLHHLQDPMKGWRILCGFLKEDGLMMISLYSKIARGFIIEAQMKAKQHGFTSDPGSMKEFRRKSGELLGEKALSRIKYVDYYNLNMYRDLLFHVQEHNYDLLDLEKILRDLNLEFLGFCLSPKIKQDYARLYPEDSQGVNLQNWHQFELQKTLTFQAMYQFWCRKIQR